MFYSVRHRKASLSLDVSIAFILIILMLVVLFHSFQTGLRSYSSSLSIVERERTAINIADYLLKNCQEDSGLASCSEKFIYSHGISEEAVNAMQNTDSEKIREKFNIAPSKQLRIRLLDLNENELLNIGSIGNEKLCIKRLVLFKNEEAILEVCT